VSRQHVGVTKPKLLQFLRRPGAIGISVETVYGNNAVDQFSLLLPRSWVGWMELTRHLDPPPIDRLL
jgi:hypothetical protein